MVSKDSFLFQHALLLSRPRPPRHRRHRRRRRRRQSLTMMATSESTRPPSGSFNFS
jgi:hypothetical protein